LFNTFVVGYSLVPEPPASITAFHSDHTDLYSISCTSSLHRETSSLHRELVRCGRLGSVAELSDKKCHTYRSNQIIRWIIEVGYTGWQDWRDFV